MLVIGDNILNTLDSVPRYLSLDSYFILALLKAPVSLQLGKIFSLDNEVAVYVMYSAIYNCRPEDFIYKHVKLCI